jgi:hypothetical protein
MLSPQNSVLMWVWDGVYNELGVGWGL